MKKNNLKLNQKILKVWPFWIEGIKYHDQYLSEFMLEDGVETIFACPNQASSKYSSFSSTDKKESKNYAYKMYFFNFISLFDKPIPYDFLKFSKFITSFKPDVIHIYGISNFTTVFTFFSIYFSDFKGEILFNDHSDPTERKTSFIAEFYYFFFKLFYRLIIKDNYNIIVPDISSENELSKRYGNKIKSKISIIPLGYDDRVFKYNKNKRKLKLPLRIGFAGRILPPKKIELLIEAVENFNSDEIELTIAGINLKKKSDYQNQLIDYVKIKNIKNIKFKNFITDSQSLAEFYSSLDLAIFPGSISITTFEANGCGCPVIIYNSYEGLDHRVSNLRGRLFDNLDQLISFIEYYRDLKYNSKIDHENIAKESAVYSWRLIKDSYYKIYTFNY